jgi:iron/zinc/copper transport system ATP-binding protein
VVHHDLNKATEYFDRLILINKRILNYGVAAEVCTADALTKAYLGDLPFTNQLGVAC